MILRRSIHEDWETIRRRMLRETEEYLADGLRRPDLPIRIPAIRVGTGEFTRRFAVVFWERVLFG